LALLLLIQTAAALGSRRVVFVRHGQSTWNADQKFTGWCDVGLTETGREEAMVAADDLMSCGLDFDIGFTSQLERAQETMAIVLKHAGLDHVPVVADWRLNERHYGSLEGTSKAMAVKRFGREQVKLWRNSYDVAPPPMAEDDPGLPANDPRYGSLPRELLPNGECLRDTLDRCRPFWESCVVPELRAGRSVLISAHGHSIRALVKLLDEISDEDIERVSMPNGMPLLYELDDNLQPMAPSVRALDACGLPSPLSARFIGGERDLARRLSRDAEVIGLDCPLPPAAQMQSQLELQGTAAGKT